MKTMADFLPEVMPSVQAQGCPQPLAINAVRNSVIEFLGKTGIVEQTIPISLLADTPTYAITFADGAHAASYVRGVINGATLVFPESPTDLDNNSPSWRLWAGSTPQSAFIEGGLLRVVPIPTIDSVGTILQATFSTTLSRGQNEVDDLVYEDWLEAIAAGALYRLQSVPGVAWFNPDQAAYQKDRFESFMSVASTKRIKGSTNATLTAAPRPFR